MSNATEGDAKCILCNKNKGRIRGLCSRCYQSARRLGELNLYPTQDFLDNPDKYVEWVVDYKREELEESLAGQGLVLITGKEYALLKNF